MNFGNWLNSSFRILFPKRCVLCSCKLDNDELCCGKCEFFYSDYPSVDINKFCFNDLICAFQYDGNIKKAIWVIKKEPNKRIIKFFAVNIVNAMNKNWSENSIDIIIPVPMSKKKLAKRGFNQSELLAKQMGILLDIDVEKNILMQLNQSKEQHSIGRIERYENANNSYKINNNSKVAGKNILLVDDVFTTGATAQACAQHLKDSGANNIYVATAAYTVLKNSYAKYSD